VSATANKKENQVIINFHRPILSEEASMTHKPFSMKAGYEFDVSQLDRHLGP
jgi:hypothetical protein